MRLLFSKFICCFIFFQYSSASGNIRQVYIPNGHPASAALAAGRTKRCQLIILTNKYSKTIRLPCQNFHLFVSSMSKNFPSCPTPIGHPWHPAARSGAVGLFRHSRPDRERLLLNDKLTCATCTVCLTNNCIV